VQGAQSTKEDSTRLRDREYHNPGVAAI
jgi:hypothetical protein